MTSFCDEPNSFSTYQAFSEDAYNWVKPLGRLLCVCVCVDLFVCFEGIILYSRRYHHWWQNPPAPFRLTSPFELTCADNSYAPFRDPNAARLTVLEDIRGKMHCLNILVCFTSLLMAGWLSSVRVRVKYSEVQPRHLQNLTPRRKAPRGVKYLCSLAAA